MNKPLAEKMRPVNIDEMIGQEHLIGKGKVLRKIIDSGNISNMILYGPPGVGKTTVANLIATTTKKKIFKLNGTTASVKDIQEIAKELNTLEGYNGIILYLDEIHAFSKQRQNSILSYLESGEITLVASTTENPYLSINSAILSRCIVFEFKSICNKDIVTKLEGCISGMNYEGRSITYDDDVLEFIASISKGDLRKSIGILEIIFNSYPVGNLNIDVKKVEDLLQENLLMDESKYYDWISMLQKSIRGSNVDASIVALGVLLKCGKMEEVIRRLLVIASEDCGLAMGGMYSSFFSLINAAKMVGMPEAKIIMSHAVILLATSPKSNTAYMAIKEAMYDIETMDIGPIQPHLRDGHYEGAKNLGVKGYKYPHDYKNNYVEQQYMPENIKNKKYYVSGNNKYERAIEEYWRKIKQNE